MAALTMPGRLLAASTAFVQPTTFAPLTMAGMTDTNKPITMREYEHKTSRTRSYLTALPVFAIIGVRIYVRSAEEIKTMSACVVRARSTKEIREASIHGGREPKDANYATPMDGRMGTVKATEVCQTCGMTGHDCPGHGGHMVLEEPFVNRMFFRVVLWVLRAFCRGCGRLLITAEGMKRQGAMAFSGYNRIQFLGTICEGQSCPHRERPTTLGLDGKPIKVKPCMKNPKVEIGKTNDEQTIQQFAEDTVHGTISSELKIVDYLIFVNGLDPKDLILAGFENESHPRDLVMSNVCVIPIAARPEIYVDGERKLDHLTTAYTIAARRNGDIKALGSTAGAEQADRRKNIRDVWYMISHLQDNYDQKNIVGSGAEAKLVSIVNRLGSHDGVVRNSAMGKRVDYSMRTVLGPGHGAPFGTVLMPRRSQRVLTIQEQLTKYNLAQGIADYREGRVVYLIPRYGRSQGGRIKVLPETRQNYTPVVGDIIMRFARPKEQIIFNRQPTLYKWAFVAYDGEFHEQENIGGHSSSTTPHNLDHDGDEGTIHRPQTLSAKVEMALIMHTTKNLMNEQANRPIVGLVYDAASAVYMMCNDEEGVPEEKKKYRLDDDEWAEATAILQDRSGLTAAGPDATRGHLRRGWASLSDRLAKHKVHPRSGRALFSTLLPADFYYNGGSVKIRDGVLVSGELTKKQVGPASGSIVQHIYKSYSPERVVQFLTDGQRIADWYLKIMGLSIGYDDCVPSNVGEIHTIIDNELASARIKIEGMGPDLPSMTELEKDHREKQVQQILNATTKIGYDISLKALDRYNPLNIMSKSGAKGNDANISQISGIVGQQFIKGVRPARTLTQGTRCLAYFAPNSTAIEANGFVGRNFITGLGPADYFFHISASRIGTIDTAVNTSDTGALHHRLAKVFEDIKVTHDGSVRNASGIVTQFMLSDGFNGGEGIVTTSRRLGTTISFLDLKSVVGKLNHERGFDYI